ncbi:MAG TPA: divalent metal cation transporter [Longimicrobiaceae bacterium]
MKKIFEVFLGIITGIGGFLEAGSLATSAQAGAQFGYQLTWALVAGTLALVVLTEAGGRLSIVSHRTVAEAMRERFGFGYFIIPLTVGVVVSLMVLASELAVVGVALQMATGLSFRAWALPLAVACWFLLWRGNFGMVEKGAGMLGLVSLAFAVGAVKLHPDWGAVAASAIPSPPQHDPAKYWFGAVSILGASISPYLFFFYSSGAVEDKWQEEDLPVNRVTSGMGMGFGGGLSLAVLILGALVLFPRGIGVDRYQEIAMVLAHPLGRWGFILFLLSLAITCFGAAAEIALATAYLIAQGGGWEWSENQRPAHHARFSLVYTAAILFAAALAAATDPLKLTNATMAVTAASLPVSVLPLLVMMNDGSLMKKHRNGWLGNLGLVLVALLSVVLLVVSIPLYFLGSG